MSGLLARFNAEITDLGILSDDPEELKRALPPGWSPAGGAVGPTAATGGSSAPATPTPARRPASARCRRPGPAACGSARPGSVAIALRQIASSAGSTQPLSWRERREIAPLDLAQQLAEIGLRKGSTTGQQAVERRAQAVDVAGRTQVSIRPAACSGLMYAGVPSRAPSSVPRRSLPDWGTRVRSSIVADAGAASGRPSSWPGPSPPPASRRTCPA